MPDRKTSDSARDPLRETTEPQIPLNESAMLDEIRSPMLLLAMPQILDPFFHMSVVLLVRHEPDGSLGFIVNRPTGVPVSEILEGLEISWQGDGELAAHFGGPVQPQLGTVIYQAGEEAEPDPAGEIYPGVRMTQSLSDLNEVASDPPGEVRLFLGYAGWGEGQLMSEIARNDWLTAPVRDDLVFGENPTEIWADAIRSVGLDPIQLPSWTPQDEEPVAN